MVQRIAVLIAMAALLACPSLALELAPTGWGSDYAEAVAQGDSHLTRCEYARALVEYERAEALAPHASQAPYKIALTLYRWGNDIPVRREDVWPLALKKTDRALFLDKSFGDAAFLSGLVRYRMGDFQSAIQVYQNLEGVRQGDPDLYMDLAVAAWRAGDMNLSTTALEYARRLDPSSRRLHQLAREILERGPAR